MEVMYQNPVHSTLVLVLFLTHSLVGTASKSHLVPGVKTCYKPLMESQTQSIRNNHTSRRSVLCLLEMIIWISPLSCTKSGIIYHSHFGDDNTEAICGNFENRGYQGDLVSQGCFLIAESSGWKPWALCVCRYMIGFPCFGRHRTLGGRHLGINLCYVAF